MSLETLFALSNLTIPFWLAMILLGWWKPVERIMRSPWVAIVPAIIYVALVIPNLPQVLVGVANPSLAGVAQLLGTEYGAAVAWAHFLAFDLLVGRWAYLDSRARGIHWLIMAPVLFFTLMLGPVGYVAYLIIRSIRAFTQGRALDAVVD
ncbi:MAG: ABA4-like family protein [Chloroflexota bacterium]|nr:ABA4-like family protein [Chloroflexota bacterium]